MVVEYQASGQIADDGHGNGVRDSESNDTSIRPRGGGVSLRSPRPGTERVIPTCGCASIGEDPNAVRFCAECHRYWRGDKKLASVSRVIKSTWPIPPDFSKADPAVLENARDRGIVVDSLFSAYVNGTLDRIPRGTRQDAVLLFYKVRRWWDGRKHENARAQVILADNEIAGTCDILDGDSIYDLKATYNVEKIYPLQLAAYAELHFATFQKPAAKLGIIHVTERYPEPKIIKVDLLDTMQDWQTMRQMWNMVQRRTS